MWGNMPICSCLYVVFVCSSIIAHHAPFVDMDSLVCEKLCRYVMISIIRILSKKLTPKSIYFGAISEKNMRQIEKFLARVVPDFRCHIFMVFASSFPEPCLALLNTLSKVKKDAATKSLFFVTLSPVNPLHEFSSEQTHKLLGKSAFVLIFVPMSKHSSKQLPKW